MTGERYPSDEDLQRIADWDRNDGWFQLMKFVRSRWEYADTAWREHEEGPVNRARHRPERVYRISTMGWSGNESLIGALNENIMFWSLAWYESRRGGHYEFRLPLST